jgi:hypothetical protein
MLESDPNHTNPWKTHPSASSGKTTKNPIKTTSNPPLPQSMSYPFWYPETEIERILS